MFLFKKLCYKNKDKIKLLKFLVIFRVINYNYEEVEDNLKLNWYLYVLGNNWVLNIYIYLCVFFLFDFIEYNRIGSWLWKNIIEKNMILWF